MKLTARLGLAASLLAGIGAVVACSGPPSSSSGDTTDNSEEGISSTDVLVGSGYLPLRRPGLAAKIAAKAKVTADARDLSYRGGPLIQNGKVFVVFWNSTVGLQSDLPGFFQTVGNSAYFDWLSEYDANGMSINRDKYLGSYVDDAAGAAGSTVTNQQIQQELERLISGNLVPSADSDTLYMVYFPPNVTIDLDGSATSCQQFCAYHYTYTRPSGQNVYYGVMPDLGSNGCQGGCGSNSLLDNTTEVSSHEWIEATTDPAVGLNVLSWYNDSYGEIGDICAWQGPGGRIGNYLVQEEWSNKNGACIVTDPNAGDGGAGDGGAMDGGSDDGGTDAGGDDAGADGGGDQDAGAACAVGSNEHEPNDDVADADALASGICGTLTAGDRDLSTFDVPKRGTYDVLLTPEGDATLKLYHVGAGGKLNRVANTSPTEVKHKSTSGGTYVAVVQSKTSSAQAYTLTLTR